MATYLSIRGYGFVKSDNTDLVEELKEKLTVEPFIHPSAPNADKTKKFPVYCESSNKLYIPRAYGLKHFGAPSVDHLHDGEDAPNLIFKGTLRAEQEAPVQCFLDAARDPLRRGGIISIECGGGKTTISLYISSQLRKKTMVVCHKEFLMNQWRERIAQFIPTARVGLIKQGKVITKDCDIVLASLQSLAMRDYPSSIFKGFHLVIIDEIHHTSAEVFSRALPKISFPVMLGLSATLKRADGLSKVFEWYVGKPVFVSKRKDSSLRVYMLPYDDLSPEYCNEIRMWGGRLNVAQMINNITSYSPRTKYILDALKFVRHNEPNRKTLILSDRRAHLAELEKRILHEKIGSVGYYVGGMKEAELKKSESKDIILGTFTMACIADDTIIIDPISGKERYIREFATEVKTQPPISLVSMYPKTETLHLSHCSNFGYSPPKPCLRILHELGEITVSRDHKVYTLDGWKAAGDLTISDYLITPRRLDIPIEDMQSVQNPDLWVLGCLLGGGDVDDDVVFLTHHIMQKSKMANEMWTYVQVRYNQFPEAFLEKEFMVLPHEKLCSLIGGLFERAGHVDGYNVCFAINSMRLANQLRTLLLRLEIRTTRSIAAKPGFPYYVRVIPEDTIRFTSIMDVRGKNKSAMLKQACTQARNNRKIIEKNRNPAPKSEWLSSVKIFNIYDVDPSSVRLCDIEVKIHHNFLASDIIVHNSEGMDIPSLDTLVLASPISSVEQSIGRIQRQKATDRTHVPTVIDIWDQFSLFKTQGFRRLQFYKKNGYEITTKLVRNQECMTPETDSSARLEFIEDD